MKLDTSVMVDDARLDVRRVYDGEEKEEAVGRRALVRIARVSFIVYLGEPRAR